MSSVVEESFFSFRVFPCLSWTFLSSPKWRIRSPRKSKEPKKIPGRTGDFFYDSGATDVNFHIPSLYSFIVRSVENLPLVAVLMILMRAQRSWSL
uniref:Uncharacterized protein n=1 Tax=Candidatus Kentrum sp. FM TaxID=2126340 RepID=A0A450SVM4_9GAMM|nr:MAG: hypothetical protein BECKFM1743C_GA0114222_101823 [Candidatus Kentron sp. FM]VFJ58044.1 MAG: hypothetical protein BECKFM1743A_GA0114220_102073 [Candidatus Kentron sp. FM]VFK11597.1 MAG: hypothetical protein BECKFM1743B_GA0114221_101963 [Candidatus Kentron sp. FM]